MGSICPHTLNYHSDVGVAAPANGEVLTWDSVSEMWIPAPSGGALTPHTLGYHSDVTIGTPTTNQVLGYNGSAWVPMTIGAAGPIALNDLTDAIITSATNGDVLSFNGTNWVNSALGAVPSHDLTDHDDVNITAPTNNQVLTYNSAAGEWQNTTPAFTNLDGLSDVVITSASVGQTLVYNGSNWVNTTATGVTTHVLNFHSDVSVPSPSINQVLTFNGTAWVAQTPAGTPDLADLPDTDISSPSTGEILVYNGSDWANETNTAVATAETGLTLLRGTLTKAASGSTWAITEGTGFTIGTSGTGGTVVTVTFGTAFSDVPSGLTSCNKVRVANGGDTFDLLSPAITSISTSAIELTEQWHSANNNIEQHPGTTAGDDIVVHFTVIGPA